MPSIDDIATDAFAFRFVRAGGPGGQHVNKVSTAVELRVDVAKCRLSVDVQARLLALAGRRANLDGEIVIHSDESRSQLRNRELALQRFSELLTAEKPKRCGVGQTKSDPDTDLLADPCFEYAAASPVFNSSPLAQNLSDSTRST